VYKVDYSIRLVGKKGKGKEERKGKRENTRIVSFNVQLV